MRRILLAGAVFLTATAAWAGGGGGPRLEATEFDVDYEAVESQVAICAGRKRALGGGILQESGTAYDNTTRASGPLDASGDPVATTDDDRPKQWYAAISNDDVLASATAGFRVYAVCARKPRGKIVEKQIVIPASGSLMGVGVARCTDGRRALGGGIVPLGDPADVAVRASTPVDRSGRLGRTRDGDTPRGWYAAVTNFSNASQIARVYVVCARARDALIAAKRFHVEAFVPDDPGKDPGAGQAAVRCEDGRLFGGGVAPARGSALGSRVQTSGPLSSTGFDPPPDDGDRPMRWYASVFNFTFEDGAYRPRSFEISAVCA